MKIKLAKLKGSSKWTITNCAIVFFMTNLDNNDIIDSNIIDVNLSCLIEMIAKSSFSYRVIHYITYY